MRGTLTKPWRSRVVGPVRQDQDQTEQDDRFAIPDLRKAPLLPSTCQSTTEKPIQCSKAQACLRPKTETIERSWELARLRDADKGSGAPGKNIRIHRRS